MSTEKLKGLLGLAMRAGRILSGSNTVLERMAREGRMVLLAQDAAGGTARQLEEKALRLGLTAFRLPLTKDELGLTIGKAHRSVVMITDPGFTERINELLLEMEVRPCE